MFSATFVIATLVYVVFNFTFAMAWNMGLFKKQYAELTGMTTRQKPIIFLGLLAIVVQAVALSTLFTLFYSGENPITNGLLFGLLLGSYSIVYGAFLCLYYQ